MTAQKPQPKGTTSQSSKAVPARLRHGLHQLLASIYPDHYMDRLCRAVIDAYWSGNARPRRRGRQLTKAIWSERDTYVITYGDSFVDGERRLLELLSDFLDKHLAGRVSGVHILPYFPFTSDDGFTITDYRAVNGALGDWSDVERITGAFRLMSDLVLNHCSGESPWFEAYREGRAPYDRFFFEASPDNDLSKVVRPRAHPLLRPGETANGQRHVWCTFSHDQVDFDFSNPQVPLEFLRIMRFHIDRSVRTIRLDAVAFIWKEICTSCIHLHQTNEIVQLMRVLAGFRRTAAGADHRDQRAECRKSQLFRQSQPSLCHLQFSLPPLILHTLLNGTSRNLNAWQMAMPPAQPGCTYFNFTASHDGIGLRRRAALRDQRVAVRCAQGTMRGEDGRNVERFLCNQAIAMALDGIPALYVHSLLATPNSLEAMERTGHNRIDQPASLALSRARSEARRSRARASASSLMK